MSGAGKFHPTCPECSLLQADWRSIVCEECGARLYMSEAELGPRKPKQAAPPAEPKLGVRWLA